MKVLVAVPVYRLWARTVKSVFALQWDGLLDIMWLKGGDVVPGAGKSSYKVVLAKYQRAREVALAGGYDAMITIEDDMVIPPDAVGKLMEVDAEIVYGLYCLRHGSMQWSAYVKLQPNGGKSISRFPEKAREAWGNVIDVAGVGNGCTLIKRKALEAIPFRLGEHAAPDWWLAVDAQKWGISQKAHLGVVCGHMTKLNKHTFVLWPDPSEKDLCRRELCAQ